MVAAATAFSTETPGSPGAGWAAAAPRCAPSRGRSATSRPSRRPPCPSQRRGLLVSVGVDTAPDRGAARRGGSRGGRAGRRARRGDAPTRRAVRTASPELPLDRVDPLALRDEVRLERCELPLPRAESLLPDLELLRPRRLRGDRGGEPARLLPLGGLPGGGVALAAGRRVERGREAPLLRCELPLLRRELGLERVELPLLRRGVPGGGNALLADGELPLARGELTFEIAELRRRGDRFLRARVELVGRRADAALTRVGERLLIAELGLGEIVRGSGRAAGAEPRRGRRFAPRPVAVLTP